MILPIGHDQGSVQRIPWVTFALLAAIAAGFIAARGAQGVFGDAPEVGLDAALEVWLTHPYLELDPALLAAARAEASDESFDERIELARGESSRTAPDAEARATQQAELDYLSRLALRGTDDRPGPNHPFRRFGFQPSAPRWSTLATHWLLHAGYWHLALALILIFLTGPALEDVFGRPLFAGLCALCALASAAGYALAEPDSHTPLIGASGLAAGLVGAFAVRHAGARIRFGWLALGTRIRTGTFGAPAWLALPLWLAAGAAMHFLSGSGVVETGESLAPSGAALATGVSIALALKLLRVEERWIAVALEARNSVQLDPRLRRALDAHARGSHDQAISLATAVLRERPDDPDALLAVWHAQLAAGRETLGLPAARRLIEVFARHGALAPAARIWDELVRALPDTRLETTVLLRIVPELVVQARRDSAIAALRCVVAPENRSLSVGQAVRAAELAAELDPPCALRAARFALEHGGDLAAERREHIETLVRELASKTGEVQPPSESPEAAPAPFAAPTAADPDLLAASEPFELEATSHTEMPTVVYTPPPRAAPVPAPAPTAAPSLAPERREPSSVKLTAAVPVELAPEGLRLRIEGAPASLLTWERIQAVGVGLVSGVAAKPIVLIDLALNWADGDGGSLEALRLRSDSFRARALVGGEGSALEALRALLAQLLARSGAVPLPDGGSARGLPFREFPDPSSYEREVLLQAG
ncbi:MAG: rhomboid family intramembrane serine protease [Myxococcota bacterium]